MKQRRNNKGGRFTNIENEREQQRKIYEDNLRKKKEQLYFEFEKQEEVLKYTKISVESHNDVKFKYEHDKAINYRIERENELENLQKRLKEIEDVNKLQEPLPEGQSLFGQVNKGTNLTSIFSKSYYRSSGLQIMSSSQQKQREDINNYITYLDGEVTQVQENLINEEQRTHQLTQSMQELFKTKQKFKDQLHDLEFLNETADRRFHDLPAVQFKAKEKKTAIEKDLNSVKKSLKEYSQIGEKYKEKQMIKMKHGEKIKKTAEEIISHDMIRQDELEKENQLLQKQIQLEVMKHQSIIEKRSESKYILKYIDCFTQFERLFLEGTIKDSEIEELYEFNNINRNTQLYIPQSEDNSPESNPLLYNQLSNFQEKRKQSTLSSADSRSPEHIRSSFNIQEEDNRLTLIQKINKFDNDHPQGAKQLIDDMIKIYNNFSYIQEGLNTNHSRLLQEKASKQQEYQDQEISLEAIKRMNTYLDEMERNPQFEKEMLSIPESLDSGLLMIPKLFQDLTNQTTSNDNSSKVMSTLNILKADNFSSANDKVKDLVQKNQNFIFNFFSNYCESAIRLCQVLELIYQFSYNICPNSIESQAKLIIQFIKDIWAGKFDENSESFTKMGKQKRQTTIQRISTQELINGEEQNIAYFKQIQSEKFSNEEISSLFSDIYPSKQKEADAFFNLIKSERIIWFFCNIEQIRDFLLEQKRKYGHEQGSIRIFDNIEELKQQGITIFENKLHNLMELMVKLQIKVKECGNTCLKIIRDTYPDFNSKRRHNAKNVRENDEIREAKLKATLKSENYFRNNDPLMEDFITLSKEENFNIALMDTHNEKLSLEQQKLKKSDEKNQDQINMLIEYIKKTKNNGQQILQEQKKLQAQQVQKNKAKNSLYSQENISSSQIQISNVIGGGDNTSSIGEGGNNMMYHHRGSHQSMNLADQKDKKFSSQDYGTQFSGQQIQSTSSQQQQQSNQTNQNSSNQDSSDGRVTKFYLNAQNKEDIARFKQLNKVENSVLDNERERIHNLSKQQQLQEYIDLQRQQQMKNNKFFISNEISEINERLHAENKAPLKEKLIRNFSESQLVLSKVDRMDRFSGFIGPAVLEKIQDEKSSMIRSLRGELYQPELNYLKSNSTYNIRKQVAQDQLHYLREVKLQQTVQLNQSHSQSIQSSAAQKNPNQHSFNQESIQKSNKQDYRQSSPESNPMADTNKEPVNEFNVQLSHFHPLNSSVQQKITANQLKRALENEEKFHKKEILNLKLKEIKTSLKLPSAHSTRAAQQQNSETRPQTQGSNQRWSKNQDYHQKVGGFSSHKKESFNSSGQNFYSTKTIRNTQNSYEKAIQGKRINTPQSNNPIGFNDLLSSENSLMFTSNNNNNNQVGPYNNQNLKFYQRYTSPEGDAFFDSILNGPFFPDSSKSRPKTQQSNPRQKKESQKNNDLNRFPLNNYNNENSYQPKPQSSHEGKRNLFYKSQQPLPIYTSKIIEQEDQIIESDNQYNGHPYQYDRDNNEIQQQQQQQQQQQYEGEDIGQYNSNRQTDLQSTISYSSSRTANTSNRPHHNQQNKQGIAKRVEQKPIQ